MKPRRKCLDCPRLLPRYSKADRCLDCYRVWVSVPLPPEPDWVVVERLMAGHAVEATTAERREAIRRLTARGLSAVDIAARVGCSDRTVVRYRSRAAAPVGDCRTCSRGHPLTPDNIYRSGYVNGRPQTRCRRCTLDRRVVA